MSHERRYIIHLTNGETAEPDICKTTDGGWLYACWTDNDAPGGMQRKYPPHAVAFYESLPEENDI